MCRDENIVGKVNSTEKYSTASKETYAHIVRIGKAKTKVGLNIVRVL